MKNKIIYSILVGVIIVLTILNFLPRKNNVLEEEKPQAKKHVDTISMMLETEANSGNYEMTTRESWPTDGYIFNSELSVCENGSELFWDDTNKKVLMSGNVSDKCYVYFDKAPTLLADYVKSLYVSNNGENGIYYHDATLTNGAGDNSYRYAGAREDVNNYVCFGTNTTPCPTDNLYRIIGVFGDQVKLIKYDYANSNLLGTDGDYSTVTKYDAYYKGELTTINTYYWNNSTKKNTWSESLLNKTNLNINFINNIGTEWAAKIDTTTWKVGGNTCSNIAHEPAKTAYQNEIVSPVTTNTTDGATEYSAKIGLMYASDYGFAADPIAWTAKLSTYNDLINANWMYMGFDEWTISRYVDYLDGALYVELNGYVGCDDDYLPVEYVGGVRPVFSLLSSITYKSGFGTQSDPILIN